MNPQKLSHSATYEHTGTLYALGYDAPDDRLYAGGSDAAISTLQPNADKPELRRAWAHHENYVSCLRLLPDLLVSGGYDRRLIWTETASGERVRAIEAHEAWIRDLDVFPDKQRLVTVGDDMRVKIWDAEGQLLHSLEGHATRTPQGYTTALYAVAVSPDGSAVASGDRIGEVRLWDSEKGTLLRTLQAPSFYTYDAEKRVRSIGGIRSVRFSPCGELLAIAGIGQVTNVDGFVGPMRIEVWNWRSGELVTAGEDKHKAVLNDVAFAPDGSWLVAGGGGDSGGILAFWRPDEPAPFHTAKPKGHLQRVLVDAERTKLYCCGFGGVQVWSEAE